MDNKKTTGKQDNIRVEKNDPSEVEYLHSKHPEMTHQQIVDAVEKYGPMRADIESHLKSGRK